MYVNSSNCSHIFWKMGELFASPTFFVQTIFDFYRRHPMLAYMVSIWSSLHLEFHYKEKFWKFCLFGKKTFTIFYSQFQAIVPNFWNLQIVKYKNLKFKKCVFISKKLQNLYPIFFWTANPSVTYSNLNFHAIFSSF